MKALAIRRKSDNCYFDAGNFYMSLYHGDDQSTALENAFMSDKPSNGSFSSEDFRSDLESIITVLKSFDILAEIVEMEITEIKQ